MSELKQTATKRLFGHNFGIVYRFEVARMLSKPSFWLSIIAFPLLMAIIFGISFLDAKFSIDSAEEELKNNKLVAVITDNSGLVSEQMVQQMGATIIDDKQAAIDQVKNGQIDAYFYYPADLANDRIEVYGKNISLFENSKYTALAEAILNNSVQVSTDPNITTILADQTRSDTHFYEADGSEANLLGDLIIPAAFLVLFYLIICVFSSQMLNATLILGGYLIAANYMDLPSLDLSMITFDPVRISIAALLFIVSILMYSGIMVAIGAATPTAKEANSFMSVPVMLLVTPFFFFNTVISEPGALIVKALMYFPLTAPVLLMTLNALGALSIVNAVVGLGLMTVTTVVIFIVAARLFQTGAIEYHKRIRLFSK